MDIDLELLLQQPIVFNDITINQPTLNDILKIGIFKYNCYLIPFMVDVDFFYQNEGLEDIENLPENLNMFDILTLDSNIGLLLDSISLFCDMNTVRFDTKEKRLYIGDKNGYLDKNNFQQFSDIILKINSKTKQKTEKPPKNMTPKQADIWKKLVAGRKRKAEKNALGMADLINICQFGGNFYIPKETILNWTLWNISRCYQSILGKSNYNDAFSIYCVSGEKDLIKQHWTDLIRVDGRTIKQIKTN